MLKQCIPAIPSKVRRDRLRCQSARKLCALFRASIHQYLRLCHHACHRGSDILVPLELLRRRSRCLRYLCGHLCHKHYAACSRVPWLCGSLGNWSFDNSCDLRERKGIRGLFWLDIGRGSQEVSNDQTLQRYRSPFVQGESTHDYGSGPH